jgi:hypothetical protein
LDPLGIRTMKQPCASAAKLWGGGPILNLGMEAMQLWTSPLGVEG